MGRGTVVTAPDGARWLVRRRWMDRELPNLRKRFQAGRDEELEDNVLGGLFGIDIDGGWWGIGLAVAVLLVVFVLLPLLGVALELIALIFFLCSGVAGRVVLGRPWIVEAIARDPGGRSVSFPIKGWRRAGEAVTELAREIATTGNPQNFDVPERP